MKYVKEFANGSQVVTQTLNGKTISTVSKDGKIQFIRAKSIERYTVGDKKIVTVKKAMKEMDDYDNTLRVTKLDKVYSQEGNLLGTRLCSRSGSVKYKELTCGNAQKNTYYDACDIRLTAAIDSDGIIVFDSKGLPKYNLSTAGLEKLV